jgi:KTSC domain
MKRQSVKSSNIASVGYDKKTSTLEIEFHHGGVYQYYHVPEQTYNSFMSANSKGQYFYIYIKENYQYKKV